MADEDVKDIGAEKPEAGTGQTTPGDVAPALDASAQKPAKKTAKKKSASKKVVAKKATRKKKTPAREAPVTAPPAVAAAAVKPVEASSAHSTPAPSTPAPSAPAPSTPAPSTPVEPVWDENGGKGFTTYLAEWGPVILLIFLVLVLDAPGGGDAPAGVTGMREATPSGGDPTKQVRVEPAASSLQSQTPPPDPAGGLGEMLTLPGTVQRTPSSNPVDQEPGAYYWGPTSQDAAMGKQQGDAWPGDGQGAAYWGPVGDSTVEGVSTIRQ